MRKEISKPVKFPRCSLVPTEYSQILPCDYEHPTNTTYINPKKKLFFSKVLNKKQLIFYGHTYFHYISKNIDLYSNPKDLSKTQQRGQDSL